MPAKHIRLLSYRTAILDGILGSECSNHGLKSYQHMTIQYKINLQDKMKTKRTSTAHYILFYAKIPFGGHLGCHAYFFKNHLRYAIYQTTSNVCFNSQMRQIETSIQALGIAKQVITYIWRPF